MKKVSLIIALILVVSSFFIPTWQLEAYANTVVQPSIAAGTNHTLALKNDGTVWAWGLNTSGQLGDGTITNKSTPVQVKSLSGITAIAVGPNHSLALKSDGTVWSWGSNASGQLGNNTTTDQILPIQVSNLSGVKAIATGNGYNLALKNDGTVWAWGLNTSGQLGDKTTINRSVPVQVSGLSDVKTITAKNTHSMVLKNDGTVWAWGVNSSGQLGDGTLVTRTEPVKVSITGDIKSIVAGTHHSLALKNDGTVWVWGYNAFGQLGDNSVTNKSVPTVTTSITDVTAISGGNHSLALKSDGTVWAWGHNAYGQLGDNTLTNRVIRVDVLDLEGVIALSAGENHTLALKNDGSVWSWGLNNYNQLGDGTTATKRTPVQINDFNLGSQSILPVTPKISHTSVAATSITLNWSLVANATGYEVEVNGKVVDNKTSTTFVHSGLTPKTQYQYRVRAKNNAGVSSWSEITTLTTLEMQEGTTQLDIEAEKYEINANTTFEVDVVIRNAEGIYAQDIVVQYDEDLLEFIGAKVSNSEAMTIYYSNTEEVGKLRYIVASNGAEYGVDGEAQILKLAFKSKSVFGEGDIKVIGGLIADGYGGEFIPEFMGKTFKVLGTDVNGDGKFTLADLGIAARLLKTKEAAWEKYTPDLDGNGLVEEIDLHEIVSAILMQQ